jgi:hypothetical protein
MTEFWPSISGLVGPSEAGPTPSERNRKTDWVDRALAELRRAIDMGIRDVHLNGHDPDFDPIRSRNDFRDPVTHAIFQIDPDCPR